MAGLSVQPYSTPNISVAKPQPTPNLTVQQPNPYGQISGGYNPQANNVNPQTAYTAAPVPATANYDPGTGGGTGGGGTGGGGGYVAPVNYSGQISSAYAPVVANFDALQHDLDRTTDFNKQQVENQYNTNRSGINLSSTEGNDNLNRSQAAVDYTKSNTLRQLQNNIGAAMQSRLNQIGSNGAGSSSAGYQLGVALHGLDNQNRNGIFDQAGQQTGDIDMQRTHLQKEYGQAIQQLDDWKSGQVAKIANDYLTQKGQIDRERAGADQTKQQALAANSLQLAQAAAAQLAQVQAAHSSAIASLSADTSGANAVANQFQPSLAAYNYSVQPMTGGAPAIQYSGPTSPSIDQFSPLLYSSRRGTAQNQPTY